MMKNIKRVAIIGNGGSGKSTLAAKLSHILHLPVYHLDKYFWQPGWIPTDPDEYKKIHDALCDQDAWIMDGMNRRLVQYRIARADIVIFLDMPRYICLWRIFKRLIKHYGSPTASSAPGCPEGLNLKFVSFLMWVWNFKRDYRPRILEIFDGVEKQKCYIFRSQSDIDRFIDHISNQLT